MIVGKRGAGIRRIMSDYKVDIKMPREGAPDSDKVVVSFTEVAITPWFVLVEVKVAWIVKFHASNNELFSSLSSLVF